MSGWRYIACKESSHGESFWTIREFYPDMLGGGDAWTENPAEPFGETLDELMSCLRMMLNDISRPWLDMAVDPPVLRNDPPV